VKKSHLCFYVWKGLEYRPFHDFRPVPLAYRPWAHISNHWRACTQALLLYKHHKTDMKRINTWMHAFMPSNITKQPWNK
jgi:hypothetical protein